MIFLLLLCAIENHYNLGERKWNITGSLATGLQQAASLPQRKIMLTVAFKDEFMKGRPCFGWETRSISFSPMFCCRWASVSLYLQSGPAPFPLLITSRARHSRWGNHQGGGSALWCQKETSHPFCPASVKCREYTKGTPLLVHDSTVVPLHSLPRRDAHATVPPPCPKQGMACSQPLKTIKYAQKKPEAQLVPLHHSPFLNPLTSKVKILL